MGKWTELSKETLINILDRVEKKDMRQCLLVCKFWQDAVYTAIYKDRIFIFNIDKLVRFLELQTPAGKYIRRVLFFLSWNDDNTARYSRLLEDFANKTPNMTSISEGGSYMSEGAIERNWFIWILSDKLLHPDRWPELESIGGPTDPTCIEFYNACVLKYAKSIRHLLVMDQTYSEQCSVFYDNEYLQLVSRITKFPCLTDLSILKQAKGRSIQLFDHLLPSTLTSVAFQLYGAPMPELEEDFSLAEVIPFPQVKDLDLSIMPGNDDSLLYIMKKFNNVKDFKLTVAGQQWGSEGYNELSPADTTCARYSTPTVAAFLEYVFGKPNHKLFSFYVKDLINIVELLSPHRLEILRLQYSERKATEPTADASFEANYIFGIPDRFQANNGFPLSIQIYKHLIHIFFINKFGEHIIKLQIDGEMTSPVPDVSTGFYLDHLFQHCPKLILLELRNHTLLQCDENMKKGGFIQELRFVNMKLHKDVLFDLSVRLPRLNTLILEDCQYTDFSERLLKSKQVYIDMPYSLLSLIEIQYKADQDETDETIILFKIGVISGEHYYAVHLHKDSPEYTLKPLDRNSYLDLLSESNCCPNYVIQSQFLRTVRFIYRNEYAELRFVTITI